MKAINFLLLFVLAINSALAGLPPTTIKGQSETSPHTNFNLQVPNYSATNVGGAYLLETGNPNLLTNPGFESSTSGDGWSSSSTAPARANNNRLSSLTYGAPEFGKQHASLTCNGASGGAGSCSFYQDVATSTNSQGVAFIRVFVEANSGSTIEVYSRVNGARTTDKMTVTNDGTWGVYKIPVITGTTSTGIEVKITVSSIQSPFVMIDNAIVGITDLKQDINIIGPWTTYTPTFTGFGTVSTQSFRWRQVGGSIEIEGRFLAGTTTATEAQITLPNSYTSSASYTTLEACNYGASTTGGENPVCLIEASKTYFTLGQSNTAATLLKRNGNGFTSATTLSLNASIRIDSLSNATSIYSASCGVSCFESFTALVTESGGSYTVTTQNVNFISSLTDNGVGDITVNFANAGLTVAPTFQVTASARNAQISTATTTAGRVLIYNNSGTQAASDSTFWITVNKQGADVVATRTIVGSFNEVMTTPGITKSKTCYYAFGGAASTLASPVECTTGTCVETYDSCLAATPPAFSSTGNYYNLTFANGTFANSSFLDCKCQAYSTTATASRECEMLFDTSDQTWVTTSSGGAVLNFGVTNVAGTASNSYVEFRCEGSAP